MIINTGSRTDIPAYYSDWFYNRIKEGYVLVRNPYYPEQVTKYLLTPELVDVLAFCTKNPEPMLARIEELKHFPQFWFVTITPYGKDIEPHVPEKEMVMESFKRLSNMVGAHAVSWRYDPIFIDEKYTLEFHLKTFAQMAENLRGYTNQCVVSFIDLYEKTKRNFPEVKAVTKVEQERLTEEFVRIGKENGMTIRLCCENTTLEKYGADISGCMTQEVIEDAIGFSIAVPKSVKSPRPECGCVMGNDIGTYNTCGHACVYCYANYDRKTVVNNMKLHDVNSPFLIGGHREGDVIKAAKQVSWRDGQISLFDMLE